MRFLTFTFLFIACVVLAFFLRPKQELETTPELKVGSFKSDRQPLVAQPIIGTKEVSLNEFQDQPLQKKGPGGESASSESRRQLSAKNESEDDTLYQLQRMQDLAAKKMARGAGAGDEDLDAYADDLASKLSAEDIRRLSKHPDRGSVSFTQLASFEYEVPGPQKPGSSKKREKKIPAAVRKLHEKEVSLEGFMLPTKLRDGQVVEFFLMRDLAGCCFGDLPRLNEVVEVSLPNGPVDNIPGRSVIVFGKLEVKEIMDDYGYVVGIYRMIATKIEEPFER